MRKVNNTTPLATIIGAALAGTTLTPGNTNAVENPFQLRDLGALSTQIAHHDRCGSGKCGGDSGVEDKCGAGKCGSHMGSKCGVGKCGGSAASPDDEPGGEPKPADS